MYDNLYVLVTADYDGYWIDSIWDNQIAAETLCESLNLERRWNNNHVLTIPINEREWVDTVFGLDEKGGA